MKHYTLSESDRRLLDAALRKQRSDPPRPAIIQTFGKQFESADSWWALPPCETGLPAAVILDDGRSRPGVAMCCIYRLNAQTGTIEAFRDAKGAVIRRLVYNAYPNTINSLVRIHQNKDGDWSNEPVAVESAGSSTSSTTPTANTTAPPSLCDGECVWIAGLDENSNLVWKTPPSGNCRNTTTSTTTTTFNPAPTTTGTTTPMACSSKPCRLRCVPVTTAAGTTSWPPAPYVPLRYEEVLDLDNPGCDAPCSCYGVGDPCWYVDATIESRCVYVNTTTSTTTTTSGPLPNEVCTWLNGGAAGPPNPEKYVAGAWSDFRNGGWQVCNACPEGKEPWVTPEQWDYQEQEDYFPVATQEFFDIARENNPGTPWEPVQGAWRFETGCKTSPCSVGGEITATEFEAEYRAFTKEDIYRYWIADACNVFGRKTIEKIEEMGGGINPIGLLPGCDLPMTPEYADKIWGILFGLPSELPTSPKISHRAYWSICKSCPPGTRPLRPPSPYIYELPENTDGALVDGVWVYKTQCVKGIDCSECGELPAFQITGQTPPLPAVTTTLAPCGCEPPRFCPTVANECTRTRCVPGGSNVPPPCTTGKPAACYDWVYKVECDCAASTTSTTSSTTSTTSTTNSCTQNQCKWILTAGSGFYDGGSERPKQWVQVSGCGSIDIGAGYFVSPFCSCNGPPTTTLVPDGPKIPVGNCGDEFVSNCTAIATTTCAPSSNCPGCSNGCYWGAFRTLPAGGAPSRLVWQRLFNSWGTPTPAPESCRFAPIAASLGFGDSRSYFNPDGSPACPAFPKACDDWLNTGGLSAGWLSAGYFCETALAEIATGCGNTCDPHYPNRSWSCGPSGRRKPCLCREPAYPPSECDWMVFTPCQEIAPPRCQCCNTSTTTLAPCQRSCVFKGDGSGGWNQLSNPCLETCPCPSPLGQSKDSCDRIELRCGSRPSTTPSGSTSSTTSSTTTARPQGSCCYSGYNPTGCVVTWQTECVSAGGQWLGAGTNCTSNPCPVTTTLSPLGRCCYNFGQCAINNATQCTALGGTWTAGILNCQNHNCPTTPAPTTSTTSTTTTTVAVGKCCYGPDYVLCSSGKTEIECDFLNGIWTQGVTCNTSSCGGFCCYTDQNGQQACSDGESSASCAVLGGVWFPYSSYPGMNCSFNPCNTTPAPGTTTLAPGGGEFGP